MCCFIDYLIPFLVERELFIDNTNFNYGESKFNILVGSFVSLTTRIVLPNTFKQLANLILTFIISAIVLRKYLICIDNVNNLLCITLIVFLITIGINSYRMIFAHQLVEFWYSFFELILAERYFYYDFGYLYIKTFGLICDIWIIILICLGVKLLCSVFITEPSITRLSPEYSQKVHLSLLILLFNFYYLTIVAIALFFSGFTGVTVPLEHDIKIIACNLIFY